MVQAGERRPPDFESCISTSLLPLFQALRDPGRTVSSLKCKT